METKTYLFEAKAGGKAGAAEIKNGAPSDSKVKTDTPSGSDETNKALIGFGKNVRGGAVTMALSPLNTATGGLATPAFNIGKSLLTGASAGAIGGAIGGLVMAGVNLALRKISERMDRLENEAQSKNNHDNVLIRGGFKAEATYYDANFFSGVNKVDR